MANKKRIHREQVFTRQAAALRRFLNNDAPELVLCPLCLRIWEKKFLHEGLTLEDAPPVQYPEATARCITCTECNSGAGGSFETRSANLGRERLAALSSAQHSITRNHVGLWLLPARPALIKTHAEAMRLASVSADEQQLELKSAYLIAFATLGHSYILGPGLDIVRSLLQPGADIGGTKVCAVASGLPSQPRVRIALEPLECVVVTHPTRHRLNGDGHVVILPLPSSPPNFYERVALLSWLPPRVSWTFFGDYEQPPPRRLPCRWDYDLSHPHRSTADWETYCEHDVASGPSHLPIRIRLSNPKAAAS